MSLKKIIFVNNLFFVRTLFIFVVESEDHGEETVWHRDPLR